MEKKQCHKLTKLISIFLFSLSLAGCDFSGNIFPSSSRIEEGQLYEKVIKVSGQGKQNYYFCQGTYQQEEVTLRNYPCGVSENCFKNATNLKTVNIIMEKGGHDFTLAHNSFLNCSIDTLNITGLNQSLYIRDIGATIKTIIIDCASYISIDEDLSIEKVYVKDRTDLYLDKAKDLYVNNNFCQIDFNQVDRVISSSPAARLIAQNQVDTFILNEGVCDLYNQYEIYGDYRPSPDTAFPFAKNFYLPNNINPLSHIFGSKDNINAPSVNLYVPGKFLGEKTKLPSCVVLHENTEIAKFCCVDSSHSFTTLDEEKETCTENGHSHKVCSKCSLELNSILLATGHDFFTSSIISKEDCHHEGIEVRTCKKCGITEEVTIPKTSHNFVYSETIKRPTCQDEGIDLYICSICGDIQERKVEKLEHTPLHKDEIPATCCEDGRREGYICSVCGNVLSGCEIIPSFGHIDESPADGICDTCSEKIGEYKAISTLDDLKDIKQTTSNDIYYLTADIDANNSFDTIEEFNGKLFGNGYTISNLSNPLININNGIISNLKISNVNVSDGTILENNKIVNNVGLLVRQNRGTIEGSSISGTNKIELMMKWGVYYGGGENPIEDIFNIVNISNVILTYHVNLGGICAENKGTVKDCSLKGNVLVKLKTDIFYNRLNLPGAIDDGAKGTSNIDVSYGGIVGSSTGTLINNSADDNLSSFDIDISGYVANKSFGSNYINMTLNQGSLYGSFSSLIEDINKNCSISSFVMTGYEGNKPSVDSKVTGSKEIVTDTLFDLATKRGYVYTSFIMIGAKS